MTDVKGKVVVVTGAGSGIGRALAVELARRGAKLALSDVNTTGLAETVKEVTALAAPVHHAKLDVADKDAVLSYADEVAAHFGVVNIVINNAGISLTTDITKMSFDQIEKVLDIDFWGVVYGTKAFLPHVIASGEGHIVNVSSLFGLLSVPGQSAYNSAKFAVRGFTEALRQEMLMSRHKVNVTCVHPGGVKTGITRNALVTEESASIAEFFDAKLARTTPESAAKQILRAVTGNKARCLVGADAKIMDALVRLGGSRYQRIQVEIMRRIMPKAPSGGSVAPLGTTEQKAPETKASA